MISDLSFSEDKLWAVTPGASVLHAQPLLPSLSPKWSGSAARQFFLIAGRYPRQGRAKSILWPQTVLLHSGCRHWSWPQVLKETDRWVQHSHKGQCDNRDMEPRIWSCAQEPQASYSSPANSLEHLPYYPGVPLIVTFGSEWIITVAICAQTRKTWLYLPKKNLRPLPMSLSLVPASMTGVHTLRVAGK